jgi:hypothetical protein
MVIIYGRHVYLNIIFFHLQLMATMVTYLVVLLQFQISIPDDSQGQELEDEEAVANVTAFTEPITTASTTITTILTTLAKKRKKN